ncbi:MAG: DUF4331 family protein [Vicinamibacteria bacterium]
MKRLNRILALGLVAASGGALFWTAVQAADHADGPAASADPTADIDDVYAWMSSDSATLNLVMTVGRDVATSFKPSDKVQYVFHTTSRPSFGSATTTDTNIIAEFDVAGKINLWVGNDEYLEGDASSEMGLETSKGRVKVYTGVRNDPFYFNLKGFQSVANTVGTVAGSLRFDPAGCPSLDAATSGVLVGGLSTGKDDFLGFNSYAIVISVDKTLVTKGGPIVSVWGSTNRK